MNFFSVRGPSLWGDYGDILVAGMTAHLERKDSILQLERTGPFLPPITFPGLGDVLVTDDCRRCLEESNLGQFRFRPVEKTRIVEYAWHEWNRNDQEPEEYPDGEPEDYILLRQHSESVAASLGSIWELVPYDLAGVEVAPEIAKWLDHYVIDESMWNGDHVFFGQLPGGYIPLVTDVGRRFLLDHASEWVTFYPILKSPVSPKEFYLRNRSGNVEAEPTIDRMRAVLAELDQGGVVVGLAHRSNWCLDVYANRLVMWHHLADNYIGIARMKNVADSEIIDLWTHLSRGEIDQIESQNWSR